MGAGQAATRTHAPAAAPAAGLRLLYGGTFDPVHDGHLAIARHAHRALDTMVWLMPAADPPHKPPPGADAAQRVRMLELAIDGEAGLALDRRELAHDGPSYTVATLRRLRASPQGRGAVAILIGADSFRALDAWHEWRALFALAHIVVAARPGSPLDEGVPDAVADACRDRWTERPEALRAAPAGRLFALRQPPTPESSSELRRRIAAGEPWRQWVPPAVADYIQAHGLYR